MCDYELEPGEKCPLKRFIYTPFCELHTDFPEDKNGGEYLDLLERKNKKIQEKVALGDYDFRGVIIKDFILPDGSRMNTSILFKKAKIREDVWIKGATIQGDARFEGAMIGGDITFVGATIEGDARFEGATLEGNAWFEETTIRGNASFEGATIGGDVKFVGAKITGNLILRNLTLRGNAISLKNSERIGELNGHIYLNNAQILGELKFKDNFFHNVYAKERANRFAKRQCEERGEKHEADKYFFREMVARREQKSWHETEGKSKKERLIKLVEYWLEWPLKYLFYYGVYPVYSFLIWIGLIIAFALIYGVFAMIDATSIWDYLYFSVTNAMTPGYGGIDPNPGIPRLVASIEAIFGTFMWASFISILARKFMR